MKNEANLLNLQIRFELSGGDYMKEFYTITYTTAKNGIFSFQAINDGRVFLNKQIKEKLIILRLWRSAAQSSRTSYLTFLR